MVDEIVVMMAPGHLDAVRAIVRGGGYAKVTAGARGRRDPQRHHALRALERARRRTTATVLFHDAVRPLVSHRIITECFEALEPLRRRRRRHPVGRHDHRGRRARTSIRDIPDREPTCAAGRPRRRSALSTIRRAYDAGRPGPRLHRHRRLRRGAALPARRPDLGRRRRGAQHEGHRPDRRLPRRQAVPADQLALPAGRPHERVPRARSPARRSSSSAAATASAPTSPRWPTRLRRARVAPFSRSTHRHPRRAARGRRSPPLRRCRRGDRPDRLRRQHRRGPAARPAGRDRSRRRSTPTEVNYLAPVFVAQAALPHLQQTEGQLLLFTSSSYTRGRSDYSLYSSAKAAVVNLTQALADEWAPIGVRVNCVNPERTGTPMRTKAFGEEPAGSLLVVRGGRADVARRADVRPDRARHRRAPGRAGRARDVAHRAGGQPDRRRPRRGGVRPGRPRQRLSRSCPEPPGSC